MNKKPITRITSLTRFLFTCPRVLAISAIIVLLTLVFAYLGNKLLLPLELFLFLLVPAFLSAIFLRPLCRSLGGDLKYKHAFFITLLGLILLIVPLKITDIIYTGLFSNTLGVIFLLLSLVFLLNLLILSTVAALRVYKATIPSLLYPITSLLALEFLTAVTRPQVYGFFLLLLITYILVWSFFSLMSAPLKKFGINLFDLITLAIVEYSGKLKQPRNPFANSGKDMKVPCQALSIEHGKERNLITVPWLHPGPLGSIGGNLPSELRSELKDKFRNIVFLHTYVDHTRDIIFMDKVIPSINGITDRVLSKAKIRKRATKVVSLRKDGVTLHGLRIGDLYVIFSSFAPKMTEDMAPQIGTELLSKFKNNIVLVDCHNSSGFMDEELYNVKPGSRKARDLIKAIDLMKKKLSMEKQYPINIGMTSSDVDIAGIKQISVLAFRIKDQTSAFIVLDANNLYPESRSIIIKQIKQLGMDVCEVLTTDTHMGQKAMEVHGKVGTIGEETLIGKIKDLVEKSRNEIKPVKLKYGFGKFEARVFGDLFENLVTVSNKLRSYSKIAAAFMLIIFFIASYYILW